MNLYNELKAIEPFSLSFHADSDGVYSASILMKMFEVSKVESPPFNDYTTDVAVDLGYPSNKDWKGIVVDHHPDHPKKRKYKLFWDKVPTGLILYNELKDHIPIEQIWKVCASLTGDGQPEKTPNEVWETFPILLEERGYLGKGQYKVYATAFTLFYYLSSGINAICRLGFPHQALDIVNESEHPLDILDNIQVIDARQKMRMEEASIYKSRPIVETIRGRYIVIKFKPSSGGIRIAGLLASKLSGDKPGKTIIAIDESSGAVSLRGVLAKYIATKLNEKGFKSGGHPGFAGSYCPPEKIEEFMNVIRNLKV